MRKMYVVRLTDQERSELQSVIKKLKGTGQKVRRAQILLKADADGPNWADERIAKAFSCRTRTVEKIRQRLVERGFDETLHRVERVQPPVEKLLTGDQEARIIATRLGPPPPGRRRTRQARRCRYVAGTPTHPSRSRRRGPTPPDRPRPAVTSPARGPAACEPR